MIHPSSSARALPPEDEVGTWGSSLRRSWRRGEGVMNVGESAGRVEPTAVVTGRKLGLGNASLSPLCLII